jgi:hypothetical protein
MPIDGVKTVKSNYDTEVLVKARKKQEDEGEAAVKLIEEAGAAKGAEQRRIKHPNSTLSIIA